jgi:hypothetical protein
VAPDDLRHAARKMEDYLGQARTAEAPLGVADVGEQASHEKPDTRLMK